MSFHFHESMIKSPKIYFSENLRSSEKKLKKIALFYGLQEKILDTNLPSYLVGGSGEGAIGPKVNSS